MYSSRLVIIDRPPTPSGWPKASSVVWDPHGSTASAFGKGSDRSQLRTLILKRHPNSLLARIDCQIDRPSAEFSVGFFCNRPLGCSGYCKIWKSEGTFENAIQYFIGQNQVKLKVQLDLTIEIFSLQTYRSLGQLLQVTFEFFFCSLWQWIDWSFLVVNQMCADSNYENKLIFSYL